MLRICKGVAIAAGLWIASHSIAFAGVDPFTEIALNSFHETITAHPVLSAGTIEQQAKYLMLVKNGLSLYRDGVLQSVDKNNLSRIVDLQVQVSSSALGKAQLSASQKALAKPMHAASLAAKQLLQLDPTSPEFIGLMGNYHSGIGYDAYRKAQDLGIDQYWN